MATKLYPPQLEGVLPAFYKSYNEDGDGELLGASITIPFGLNRAVNITSISNVALRLRTTSTSTYILADVLADAINLEEGWATFNLIAKNDDRVNDINESQYYRAQLAFVDDNQQIGYYSTVGIIKCIAKPTVQIIGFSNEKINSFLNEVTGEYIQDTSFGDSTEKAYSYIFNLWDEDGELIATSGEKLHDVTQDTSSSSSIDLFKVYKELKTGLIYRAQYTVTTMNGLVISTDKYKVMKMISVESEYPIKLHAKMNFEEGFVELTLKGDTIQREIFDNTFEKVTPGASLNESQRYYYIDSNTGLYTYIDPEKTYHIYNPDTMQEEENNYYAKWNYELISNNLYVQLNNSIQVGEEACNGTFLITRACDQDDYFEWEEIMRFSLADGTPSDYKFYDYTVAQGFNYKYGIQQYNLHGIYSRKILLTDPNDLDSDGNEKETTIRADFEDMFLYDGKRQLKVRFDPKVAKFTNQIPEQKIETIGSKYPFIFRNGQVCYKEFSIAGLITYQEDDNMQFLTGTEIRHAGIMDYQPIRTATNADGDYRTFGHEAAFHNETITTPVYDIYTGRKIGTKTTIKMVPNKNPIQWTNKISNREKVDTDSIETNKMIRTNKDLTSENIMGERFFKLKVLDWLTDGKVKLFRSPTEGNYLVRLLKVSLKPNDKLGRMIHTFTCTADEIGEVNYDNLVYYKILRPSTPNIYETHWGIYDIADALQNEPNEDGFYKLNIDSTAITSLDIQDFAPGDQIKVIYNDVNDDSIMIYEVGATGALNLNNDDRPIVEVWVKPNPNAYGDFSRSFIYQYNGLQSSQFDEIADIQMHTQVAEQFVGPKENLLEPFNLRNNAYGEKDNSGFTPYVYSKDEGYLNVYNSLVDRNHITYMMNDSMEKITGLKFDIIQVHKRDLIPVFAYQYPITKNTKFGVTPFGKGFVNNRDILQFIEDQKIRYAEGKYISIDPYDDTDVGVNINDIYDIYENNKSYIDHFTILKTFYFDNNQNTWLPVVEGPYQYFDTYTNSWWSEGIEYDPTFSINELENFENAGSNDIRLSEKEKVELRNLGKIDKLRLGNGVYAEVTVQLRIIEYNIEEDEEPVKTAKNNYLQAKENFAKVLENVLLNSLKIQEALEREKYLNERYVAVKEQLDLYGDAVSAVSGVKEVTKEQIIMEKQILYTELRNKFEGLINILQNTIIPLTISDGTSSTDRLLNDINFVEENPQNDYTDRSVYQRDINFIKDTLDLQNFSTDNNETVHNIIDDFNYIYVPIQDAIIKEQSKKAQELNSQIHSLTIQLGNLSGTYDELQNGELSENTIAYYDQQLQQAQESLENLTNNHIENITNLINQFLVAILKSKVDTLTEYTDAYIVDNAEDLKTLLETLITDKERILSNMANYYNNDTNQDISQSIYNNYKELVEAEKAIYESNLEKVEAIIANPGTIDRLYGTQNTENTAAIDEFKQSIDNDKAAYVKDIIDFIKTQDSLASLSDDILSVISTSTIESLLNLMTDKYNKPKSQQVSQLVKTYYKDTSPDNLVQILQNKINQAKASYETQKTILENTINTITGSRQILINQTNEIQNEINNLNSILSEVQNQIDDAQSLINEYNAGKGINQEGQDLIEFITGKKSIITQNQETIDENKNFNNNVQILSSYLDWINEIEEKLKNQIGELYSKVEDAKEYTRLLLALINEYELEAFQFLHKYDALEDDLRLGFNNKNGIDELYENLDKFNLYKYKDIFYLGPEEKVETKKEDLEAIGDGWQSKTSLAYNFLNEQAKKELLLPEANGQNETSFGIFLFKGKYYLAQFDGPDEFYPAPVWFGVDEEPNEFSAFYDGSRQNTPPTIIGEDENGEIIIKDWVRDVNAMNNRTLRAYPEGTTYDPSITYYTGTNMSDIAIYKYIGDEAWRLALKDQKIKWITEPPVRHFTYKDFSILYDSLDYYGNFMNLPNNQKIAINPVGEKTFWRKYLGLIIHDNNPNTNEEQGSFTGLYQYEEELRIKLCKYLEICTQQYNEYAGNETYVAYIEASTKLTNLQSQIEYWQNIKNECQLVKENWDVNDSKTDTTEKAKLEQLLLLATNKLLSLQKLQKDLQKEFNTQFSEFLSRYQVLDAEFIFNKNAYENAQKKLNDQYELYKRKVLHYLYLLYNSTPYGTAVDKEIAYRLHQKYLNQYNFGLGYAIDNYKLNQPLEDQPLNFADSLEKINKVLDELNNNFDLFTQVLPEQDIDPGLQYYKKIVDDNGNISYNEYDNINNNESKNEIEQGNIYTCKDTNLLDFYNPNENNGGLRQLVNNLLNSSDYVNDHIQIYLDTLILYNALLEQEAESDDSKEELQRQLAQYKIELDELAELTKYGTQTEVNEQDYIDDIRSKLAEYLRILAVTYVDKVERRYGVV